MPAFSAAAPVVLPHSGHSRTSSARPAPARAAPAARPAPRAAAAAPPPSPGGPSGPSARPRHGRAPRAPRSPDYYVNVGAAIDALRADYPCVLSRTPDLSKYADNVVFRDRSTGYKLEGKSSYSRLFWALRMQAALCFSSSNVVIHSLFHDDDKGVLYLRWRLQGSPRVWGLIHPPPVIVVDAMSVYSLNVHGFLCEHVLDNSAPARPRKEKLRPFLEDVLALGGKRVATPEPAGGKVWPHSPWPNVRHQNADQDDGRHEAHDSLKSDGSK